MSLSLYLAITLLFIFVWYVIGLIRVLKQKGLDPSLITTISPLNFRNDTGLRLVLGINLITCLILPVASWPLVITCLTSFGFAISQIVLLGMFNRSATQPVANYYLVCFLVLLALNRSLIFSLVLLSVIAPLQEVLLLWFSKSREKKYNAWVEKQVHHINKQHGSARGSLSDTEWFHTLHIAVTENIARPRLSRLAEILYFHLKHPSYMSSGIMQVMADELLSDEESIKRGSLIIKEALLTVPDSAKQSIDKLRWLAHKYNGGQTEENINRYTNFLLLTYPGTLRAWQKINNNKT